VKLSSDVAGKIQHLWLMKWENSKPGLHMPFTRIYSISIWH